jgi:tRNA pseudouridine65 synthase
MTALHILYQDEAIIAINKPHGVMVHRSTLAPEDEEAILQRLRDQIGQWVFPVHRLDRGTSGVLLFAFTPSSARILGEQFQQHTITKHYWALIRGKVPSEGRIDYPLATLSEQKGQARFKIVGSEKEAITQYQCLTQYRLPYPVSRYQEAYCSMVNITPQQGRKHQIRRHFKHIHHPLIGDTRYGCRHYNKLFRQFDVTSRLCLHATRLQFQHPINQQMITIEAPFDPSLQALLEWLAPFTTTPEINT